MRARLLKPVYFEDQLLSALPIGAHFLFAGLWCAADRDGRLLDSPRMIAGMVFPWRSDVTDAVVDQWLGELDRMGFICRYEALGVRCIQVVNFARHQKVHPREAPSELPPPPHADQGEPKASQRQTFGVPKANLRQAQGGPCSDNDCGSTGGSACETSGEFASSEESSSSMEDINRNFKACLRRALGEPKANLRRALGEPKAEAEAEADIEAEAEAEAASRPALTEAGNSPPETTDCVADITAALQQAVGKPPRDGTALKLLQTAAAAGIHPRYLAEWIAERARGAPPRSDGLFLSAIGDLPKWVQARARPDPYWALQESVCCADCGGTIYVFRHAVVPCSCAGKRKRGLTRAVKEVPA